MGEITSKICKGPCGKTKPLEAFAVQKLGKYGRTSKCKLCRKELYVEPNKEAIKKFQREYYEANKEYFKDKTRAWREANRDKRRSYDRKHREENKEHYREYEKNRSSERRLRRTAVKLGNYAEKVDYRVIRERDDTCYLCSTPFTDEERHSTSLTHIDHKIPLDKGGEHSYANCALTHAFCNLSKGAKTPDEYFNWKLTS